MTKNFVSDHSVVNTTILLLVSLIFGRYDLAWLFFGIHVGLNIMIIKQNTNFLRDPKKKSKVDEPKKDAIEEKSQNFEEKTTLKESQIFFSSVVPLEKLADFFSYGLYIFGRIDPSGIFLDFLRSRFIGRRDLDWSSNTLILMCTKRPFVIDMLRISFPRVFEDLNIENMDYPDEKERLLYYITGFDFSIEHTRLLKMLQKHIFLKQNNAGIIIETNLNTYSFEAYKLCKMVKIEDNDDENDNGYFTEYNIRSAAEAVKRYA